MNWALDDQVAGVRVGRSCARTPTDEVAADAAAVQRRRASRSPPPPGRSGVCGASVPVFGGVLLDLTAIDRHRRRRPHVDARRRAARHVRRRASRTSSAPSTASPAGTGRSRWRSRPSAAGSRAEAPASSRRATARSRTSSPASTSCSPTARSSRPVARRVPRSAPISRSCSSARKERSASSSARGCACIPLPPARDPRRVRVHVVRRRPRRDAPDRAARRHARGAAPLRRDRGRSQLPDRRRARVARDGRRRRGRGRRDPPHRRRRVRRRRRDRRRPGRAVDGAPQRRVGARSAHQPRLSSSTRWRSRRRGARSPTVYERATPRSRRSSTRWSRPRTRATRTPTARASTSPSPASPPAEAERECYYARPWDAGQRAVLAAGGALEPPPRRRARTVPGSSPRRSATASACCSGEGRARPQRHPQPRQARLLARTLRPDVAWWRERGARRRRRHEQRARRDRARRRTCSPSHDTRAAPRLAGRGAGGVRRDAARQHVPRARDRRARAPTGRSTGSASPTSAARRSCGTARPARRSGRGSVGRTCARSARASRCAPKVCASARTSRRPRCSGCSTQLDDRAAPPSSASAPSTRWVAWTLSGGSAARDRRDQRRASPACRTVTLRRGTTRCSRRSASRTTMHAGDRRLGRRRRRSERACRARPRSPRSSATSRRRWSARAACTRGDAKITFGTGGMLDVVLGDDAAPSARSAIEHGTFPIVAWRHAGTSHLGRRSGDARGGHQRAVAARRSRAHRERPTRSHAVAAACADSGGVVFVPAPLGLGTPQWDYGARQRAVRALTRGTGRAEIVRAVLEGIAHRGADLVDAAERRHADHAIPSVRVDGGMTDNPTFVQALADATGRPVEDLTGPRGHHPGRGTARLLALGHVGSTTSSPPRGSHRVRVEPVGRVDRDRWREAWLAPATGSPPSTRSISDTLLASVARVDQVTSTRRVGRRGRGSGRAGSRRRRRRPRQTGVRASAAPVTAHITTPSKASDTAPIDTHSRVLRALLQRGECADAEREVADAHEPNRGLGGGPGVTEHEAHEHRRRRDTRSPITHRAPRG